MRGTSPEPPFRPWPIEPHLLGPSDQNLTPTDIAAFRKLIYGHFQTQGRRLPWRETRDPYAIVVSELMLQQTGVERVLGKYGEFLERFPDFGSLARATVAEVLTVWQGLGYNRRALHLLRLAQAVVTRHAGRLPNSEAALRDLPGIGPATAGAVAAFAFSQPAIFIETNIRRVFLHIFFPDVLKVPDRRIVPLVAQTLDATRPRRWYYALMDYGAWLKRAVSNPNRHSAHYARPSRFTGSDRQVRGAILRYLLEKGAASVPELAQALAEPLLRVEGITAHLREEGFLEPDGGRVRLAGRRMV